MLETKLNGEGAARAYQEWCANPMTKAAVSDTFLLCMPNENAPDAKIELGRLIGIRQALYALTNLQITGEMGSMSPAEVESDYTDNLFEKLKDELGE